MTETTTRLRWEPGEDGILFGYCGILKPQAFVICPPGSPGEFWMISTSFPLGQPRYVGSDGEAQKAAEGWVEEFVTSLGAAFPAESGDEAGQAAPPAKRPVLTSRYVFDVLHSAGFTPWGNGEPGFTTGWYCDAITVDHVGADLPVHGPLEGPRAIIADYAQTLFAAGFDTHVTVNTVLVRKRAAAKTATAGEE